MPNDQTVGFDWGEYCVSVKYVEKPTGYTSFSNVPGATTAALKRFPTRSSARRATSSSAR